MPSLIDAEERSTFFAFLPINDVKIGMVDGSAFAFVADGRNGLRVLQIVSSFDDPAHFSGFSPRPTPKLIATSRTRGPALAISKGIDRDRAVDESGNQLAVFGRRGARPLNHVESQRLFLRGGQIYTVTDEAVERRHRFRHFPGLRNLDRSRLGLDFKPPWNRQPSPDLIYRFFFA